MSYNKRLIKNGIMGLKIYSSTLNLSDLHSTYVAKALASAPTDRVCGLVFCGVSDELGYHDLLSQVKSAVYDVMGRKVPVTLIPQYLFPNGGLSLDVYTLEGDADIVISERDGVCYGRIENEEESLLFVEGIPASDFSLSVRTQSDEVFAKLDGILSQHAFAVDDIVRQWNYIGNIVGCRGTKQNYQEFNDARSCYYAKGAWGNGYPAATGIGTSYEGIVVGGIAFKKANGEGIFPIDNPLQIAAHVYSKRVLIDDDVNAMKSTPKFERAKLIETKAGACCFVSGTAAIRGEESKDASSAKLQTIMTIENIAHLVSKENLVKYGSKPYDLRYVQIQVFIKNVEDYDEVRAEVEKAYPNMPVVYSVADVCRTELLVEIEAILIS